ncbi:MAG TPA: phosphotransferase, partial [Candidatus Limnocylindrales bacterium]|nr:phosphotransferase [Candidatus Limnocylindrales bacterium]
ETGLRVPVPVPNRAGDAVTRVEVRGVPDARDCVLFDWVPGRQLDDDLRPDTMAAYGALAAQLHEHAATFRPSPTFEIVRYDRVFPFDQPVILFDPAHTSFVTDAQREVFRAGAEVVEGAIESLRAREPARVLHGDLHRWNVLVERRSGGAAPALAAIDFEDLCWGWPVQDLAIALYYLHEEPTYPEILPAFRAGYESVRPWPDATGDEIATLIAGRAIVLANDVELLEDPEVRADGLTYMARFERRVRRLLER